MKWTRPFTWRSCSASPGEAILGVGAGGRWSTVEQVIAAIEAEINSFYVLLALPPRPRRVPTRP